MIHAAGAKRWNSLGGGEQPRVIRQCRLAFRHRCSPLMNPIAASFREEAPRSWPCVRFRSARRTKVEICMALANRQSGDADVCSGVACRDACWSGSRRSRQQSCLSFTSILVSFTLIRVRSTTLRRVTERRLGLRLRAVAACLLVHQRASLLEIEAEALEASGCLGTCGRRDRRFVSTKASLTSNPVCETT